MITLHYLKQSCSHRILWLLEELGLDYELKFMGVSLKLDLPLTQSIIYRYLAQIEQQPSYLKANQKSAELDLNTIQAVEILQKIANI